MSSSGIRRRRDTDDRTDDAIKGIEDTYITEAKRFTDRGRQETGNAGPGAIGGPSIPGASYLPISGTYGMIGSIAYNPITRFITDGRIDITPAQSGGSKDSTYVLATGQGSPDTLHFIDGASKNGQDLRLQGTETQIIILKHALLNGIASISGEGTVTVTTTTDHGYVTGEKVNIFAEGFNISNVEITVTSATEFEYSAAGNATSQSSGVVQNGNIVTPDGADIILDGTISPNGIPMAGLIFDPTVEGLGAWRIQFTSISSGGEGVFLPIAGGAMLGPIAYDPDVAAVSSEGRVAITSSYMQTFGSSPPTDVFFFDGALFNGQQLQYQVVNQNSQVIKNAVLKNLDNIVGNGINNIITVTDDSGISPLITDDMVNIKDTTNFNKDNVEITVTSATTFTYNLGSIGSASNETSGTIQRGNIVMPDDMDLTLDSSVSTLGTAIASFVFDPTISGTGWRLISSTVDTGGGDGFSDPLTQLLITLIPVTLPSTTEIDSDTATEYQITLDKNIEFNIIGGPASGRDEVLTIFILQNGTGGFTIDWGTNVSNPPDIETDPNESTTVVLVSRDQGATWTVESAARGGAAGSQTPWIQNIDGAGFTLTDAGDISIKNVQTDGLEAVLTLERNDNTPTDGDEAGTIFFVGPVAASSGGAITGTANYGAIEVKQIAVTTGAKNAQLTISAQNGNTFLPILDYTGDDSILKVSSGVDVLRGNSVGGQELGTLAFPWDDVFSETFTMKGSGGNTSGAARTIYHDNSSGMIFNLPSAQVVAFTHSASNVILSLLTDGELNIRTTLEDGPILRLQNNDQSPTNNDTAATILFTGEDSGLDEQTYGSIEVDMDIVTAAGMVGDMTFRTRNGTLLKPWMNYLGGQDKINIFSNMDMGTRVIDFDEETAPTTPASGTRRLFVDSGTGELSVRTSSATTVSLEGAASGANNALSNLTTTSINENLLPNGTVTLGATGDSTTWDDAFIETINAVSSIVFNNAQNIFSTGTNLVANVPTNSLFRLQNGGVTYTELANTGITITRRNTSSSQFAAAILNLQRRDSATIDDNDFVGLVNFQGDNSVAALTTYAEIRGVTNDISDGSEDGGLSISIINNSSSTPQTVIEMEASGGNLQLGFFGVAPVVQQTPAATVGGIISALESLGLFV